jgi:hypothetical protein
MVNEIKIFYQNSQQLGILLQETKNSCKELTQQPLLLIKIV